MNETLESPFPTYEQELLLKASLLEKGEALLAWEKWNEIVDFEGHLDNGSFRLLPLLYMNLLRFDMQHKYMGRLKGAYKQVWYKNQKLMYDSRPLFNLLHGAGIKTLVLKGAALSILTYKDFGVRPMADIDTLVPLNQARLAIDVLQKAGWKPQEIYLEYNLRYGRSMQFSDESGYEFDLHWHPFFESHGSSSENDFWDQSVPVTLSDIPTLALCSTDNLLHTIVHGMRWNAEPPIRWIPDAFYLINSQESPIDWDRLLMQVKKYKVVLQIKNALYYLIREFKVNIPSDFMHDLEQIPITFADRVVYRYSKIDTESLDDRLKTKLSKLFVGYLRQTHHRSIIRQLIGFAGYLRFRTAGKKHLKVLYYYFTVWLKNIRANKQNLPNQA